MAALVGPLIPSEVALEDSRPSNGLGLAIRKDHERAEDVGSASAIPTLATLLNIHSGEAVVLSDSEPTNERFSALLGDRVTGSQANMDPRLAGLLRAIAHQKKAPARIELVSGYRSWKLNEFLRKKGRRVASHSQHTLGRAMDFRVQGMTPKQLREVVERSGWQGGIGIYPGATDRFVHADTGPKRHWVGH